MAEQYLKEKEKRIMSALYRLQSGGIGVLAKETLINRTTLYPILNQLLEKGLVSQLLVDGKIVYQPISRQDFKAWIGRRTKETEKEISDLTSWFDSAIKEKNTSLISEVSYFSGMEGVKSLYADTWRNNKNKIIYCITDYVAAADTMKNFFHNEYLPKRIGHDVKVKDLVTESKIAREYLKTTDKFLREMRFAKGLFENLGIEINIYDDKVAIVAFDKRSPSGVIIKNAKIAGAIQHIFDYLWNKAR